MHAVRGVHFAGAEAGGDPRGPGVMRGHRATAVSNVTKAVPLVETVAVYLDCGEVSVHRDRTGPFMG